MILLITNSFLGRDCKLTLQRGCGERVHLVETITEGVRALQQRGYLVVVLDTELAQLDSQAEKSLLGQCGCACPVYVNFGIASCERVLAEVRGALRRRQAERTAAATMANSEIREDLRNAVTGILLSSELAMSVPNLPRSAQVKMKFVYDLAQGMRRQLEA